MNIPILIVACITAIAVLGHVLGGTRETASIVPSNKDKTLTRNWKQAMGAFQMLSIDLLLVAIALFLIALTDIITFEYELTLILSLLYFLWGLVWLIQLLWLKSELKTYLHLPHWALWFVCSGLLYYGAAS